jgi:hypothetical protein
VSVPVGHSPPINFYFFRRAGALLFFFALTGARTLLHSRHARKHRPGEGGGGEEEEIGNRFGSARARASALNRVNAIWWANTQLRRLFWMEDSDGSDPAKNRLKIKNMKIMRFKFFSKNV